MVLSKNVYFVKEKVGMFKASNQYDIFDPHTGEELMHCREPNLGALTKILRFTDYKRMSAFNVEVTDTQGNQIVRVSRGFAVLNSNVKVFDHNDEHIGTFRQKIFTLVRQKFQIQDASGNNVCELKAKNWRAWNFVFMVGDREVAQVTKKWAGIGKELFTSADNYVLTIDETVPADSLIRRLVMAATMTIDMVLKE